MSRNMRKAVFRLYADSKDLDQLAEKGSLIRNFAILYVLQLPMSIQ